jgi:hypothetical protein
VKISSLLQTPLVLYGFQVKQNGIEHSDRFSTAFEAVKKQKVFPMGNAFLAVYNESFLKNGDKFLGQVCIF